MNSITIIHLFLVIIVGGLFLYVGINRDNIYGWLFKILFYLGFIIILYHLYKVYGYLKDGKGIWVNLIHIFIVGPILIYIGYNGAKTARKFFEILLMLGFASIGYHLYYLFKQ
jgi:hypothetical protein